MLRRNGVNSQHVREVSRGREGVWWEGFVKEVGLEPGAKE